MTTLADPGEVSLLIDKFAPVFAQLTAGQAAVLLSLDEPTLLERLTRECGAGTGPPDPVFVSPRPDQIPAVETGVVRLALGDRLYDLVPFLRPGESRIVGEELVRRGRELKALATAEDCRWFRLYDGQIPAALQGKVLPVFAAYRQPNAPCIAYWTWSGTAWTDHWYYLGNSWQEPARLVRRVT